MLLVRLFNANPLEDLRQVARGVFSRLAFGFESACVAVGVLSLLTFAAGRFDALQTAGLWGGFWTHYANASPAAREPVTGFLLALVMIVSCVVAFIRYPRARRAFEPFLRDRPAAGALMVARPEAAL